MSNKKRLVDEYQFPGFRPRATVRGIFGDPMASVVQLERRQKKLFAVFAEDLTEVFTIAGYAASGICRAVKNGFIWMWKFAVSCANGAGK